MKIKLFPFPYKWLPIILLCLVLGIIRLCRPSVSASKGSSAKAGAQGLKGPIRFTNVASAAGLNYRWQLGRHPTNILQGVGNGCAFLDYNNDGNLDILLIGPHLALYQGDGKGHFTDVTQKMGLATLHGAFDGCCVGDYDNDGFDDVYISGYHTGILLHNDQGKRFTDVTDTMGIAPQRWGTSCAFVDTNNDGYLDLIIANYVNFDPAVKANCLHDKIEMTCGPADYPPLSGTLYHNIGGRHFKDATRESGIMMNGAGLGVACADYDGSGHPSIAVANDLQFSDMLYSDGKEHFRNVSMMVGTAGAPGGHPHAGMGIDWGDYDNDGRLDLFVTTFQREPRSLYHNNGDGTFMDLAMPIGLYDICKPFLGFGTKFVDVDNDGWLDIVIANGHVQDNISHWEPTTPYRQTAQLLHNELFSTRRFTDVSTDAGFTQAGPILGRGLAVGDFDNDGRMDVLVVDTDGSPLLLHNESEPVGHWLTCRLIGTTSNRDGIGALLTATFQGSQLLRRCGADGSYLSSSDKRVHFGLGVATAADISVHWPSGKVDVYKSVQADRIVELREGVSTFH